MPKQETEPLGECSTPQIKTQSNLQNPISRLNEYCQKHSYRPPKYDEVRVGEQEFKYTVTYQGKPQEGPTKRGKLEAKRAAAQMIIDSFNSDQ